MPATVTPPAENDVVNSGPVKLVNGTSHVTNGHHTTISNGISHSTTSKPFSPSNSKVRNETLKALYSSSVVAKIWGVAMRELDKHCTYYESSVNSSQESPPTEYPEYTQPQGVSYITSPHTFWTSGFFPGSLYLLRARLQHHPSHFPSLSPHPLKLQHAARWWTANLHSQASRTDTHDLGFMIKPWAQLGWELDRDVQCFDTLVTAAHALASRFDERVGCVRSWDTCFTKRYAFGDPAEDFLVIIDNMMNLDLLYYVADLTHNPRLATIATNHAFTTMKAHIRDDNSTCHVVNFEQSDGSIKERITNQGLSDESCWSRGQAWGITGFAQAYRWTKERQFLDAACRLADYFLERLSDDGVPYWDFDAPIPGPRDSSAGLIAAYGMLLLHQAESGEGRYLDAALRIVEATIKMSLAPEARFVKTSRGDEAVDLGGLETIVGNATINNYEFAPRRWADHGLIYADYYFLLVGNELLKMGVVWQ
ncbi:glucuronyl hydrolase [Dendryphion nanum]|uniref:Glucuronyl hydrolase n=1 Tax=Dendryphion nanum TaxID=256645 RepID=A0A9P9IXV6_9PLEO|nr:glucuronyl hydrolase [Dendryphion nanum]